METVLIKNKKQQSVKKEVVKVVSMKIEDIKNYYQ